MRTNPAKPTLNTYTKAHEHTRRVLPLALPMLSPCSPLAHRCRLPTWVSLLRTAPITPLLSWKSSKRRHQVQQPFLSLCATSFLSPSATPSPSPPVPRRLPLPLPRRLPLPLPLPSSFELPFPHFASYVLLLPRACVCEFVLSCFWRVITVQHKIVETPALGIPIPDCVVVCKQKMLLSKSQEHEFRRCSFSVPALSVCV